MRMTDNNQKIPTTTKNSQDADISFVSVSYSDLKEGMTWGDVIRLHDNTIIDEAICNKIVEIAEEKAYRDAVNGRRPQVTTYMMFIRIPDAIRQVVN
jgi:hypothetical protein